MPMSIRVRMVFIFTLPVVYAFLIHKNGFLAGYAIFLVCLHVAYGRTSIADIDRYDARNLLRHCHYFCQVDFHLPAARCRHFQHD